MRLTSAACAALLMAAACSGSTSSAGGTRSEPATRSGPTRGSANHLTSSEVTAAGADISTALDLVQRMRPAMLRSRVAAPRSDGSTDVMAYLDGVKLGTWRDLSRVHRSLVQEIRYYTPSEATRRWGSGHVSGAIEVTSRK